MVAFLASGARSRKPRPELPYAPGGLGLLVSCETPAGWGLRIVDHVFLADFELT